MNARNWGFYTAWQGYPLTNKCKIRKDEIRVEAGQTIKMRQPRQPVKEQRINDIADFTTKISSQGEYRFCWTGQQHEQTIHESTRHGPYHLYVLSSMANAEGGAYRFTCSLLWNEPCWWNSSYSLTVFSPSGKLVQIEHALAAVSQGTTSLGIKGACIPLGTRSI